MLLKVALTRRFFSVLVVAGCVMTGLPAMTLAQGLPGLTLFGGPKNQLNYRLDYGKAGMWGDRYRLRIPAKQMELGVKQFSITYPDDYEGEFDIKRVEVRVEKKKVAIDEVIWDKENHIVEIYPTETIPAGTDIEIVFSNVQNPARRGMYYFNCRILAPGDVPLVRYLGTWVLTIS